MATRYCDECTHYYFESADFKKHCKKGHAPKFFLPKKDDYGSLDWGWKRDCGDFEMDGECPSCGQLNGNHTMECDRQSVDGG